MGTHTSIIRSIRCPAAGFFLASWITAAASVATAQTQFGENNSLSLNPQGAVDNFDLEREFGYSLIDTPHRLNISGTLDLPFGVGKRWLSDSRLESLRTGSRIQDDQEVRPRVAVPVARLPKRLAFGQVRADPLCAANPRLIPAKSRLSSPRLSRTCAREIVVGNTVDVATLARSSRCILCVEPQAPHRRTGSAAQPPQPQEKEQPMATRLIVIACACLLSSPVSAQSTAPPRTLGGYVNFGLVVPAIRTDVARREGISTHGFGGLIDGGIHLSEIVVAGAALGFHWVRDDASFTQNTTGGQRSSSASLVDGAVYAGVRSPSALVSATGWRLTGGVNIGQGAFRGQRGIANCVNCAEESLHLGSATYVEPIVTFFKRGSVAINGSFRLYRKGSEAKSMFLFTAGRMF